MDTHMNQTWKDWNEHSEYGEPEVPVKSRLYPEEVLWKDWKNKPLPDMADIATEEWDGYSSIKDGEEPEGLVTVEFWKGWWWRHSKAFIEDFLYEYQQALSEKFVFEYGDFPQTLDRGPEYIAWLSWIEYELKANKRISYDEFIQLILECRKEKENG